MSDSDLMPIRRALLSVSDKTDLVPFARRLAEQGVTLISTGGTARVLREAGLDVTPIEDVTQFPEMMDGRVKTLHPRVHGGLLALRDRQDHADAMQAHGIEPIDLICINLYPFEQTIAREGVDEAEAIENIDIGGPSMIRSAAKNHRFVTVVTDPEQYDDVVNELTNHGGATTESLRRRLALSAFTRTAAYDTAIAEWLSGSASGEMPECLLLRMTRESALRYGENPHQGAALYRDPASTEPSVTTARQRHGKALSFNNLYDANGALELVKEIDPAEHAAVSVIKHANPCGFALADDLATAFTNAYAGDPLAAFGGIVATNRTIDAKTADAIAEGQKFLEVIVAPAYEEAALKTLQGRWKNVRLLETGDLAKPADRAPRETDMKRLTGGLLVQDRDLAAFDPSQWTHAAGPEPGEADILQMRLAMIAVKHLKSNAISLIRDHMLVGGGAGQMDRVASCRIAIEKAGERANGAVAGSDAFFPFRDGPDALIAAGVRGIVHPGGSKRDEETAEACQEAGVTLMYTHRRHFRH